MRNESVTVERPKLDLKALGYLVSIVSVLMIGVVAWPAPGDPAWAKPILIGGMAASIIGMGLRYLAHLDERAKFKQARGGRAGKPSRS